MEECDRTWKLRDQNDFLLAEETYSGIFLGPFKIGNILLLKGKICHYKRICTQAEKQGQTGSIVLICLD